MKRLTAALIFVVCLGGPSAARAQEPQQPQQQRAASHTQAAVELLELMGVEKLTLTAMDSQLKNDLGMNPQLAPFEDVMRQFLTRHLAWEKIGPRQAAIYADAFSEAELREMLAFYRTKTGRKMAALLPELMQKGAALGAQVVQENQAELQQMLTKRTEELERQKKP